MKRALLIPHDDRPPNLQFPRLLGRIAGVAVVTPPRRLLGSCGDPGEPDIVLGWSESRVRSCQAAIVSLNFTSCGGLVASRQGDVSTRTALTRLVRLKTIRRLAPRCLLYAFGSITKSHQVREKTQEHTLVRQRNIRVFRRAVELVRDGVIDYLALGQDDAEPGGAHVAEREAIRALAADLGVADRVGLLCGTDETAMLLPARAVNAWKESSPSYAIRYLPAKTSGLVPLFEDEAVSKTLCAQVACAGGRVAQGAAIADCLVQVLGPEKMQEDLLQSPRPSSPSRRHIGRLFDQVERTARKGGRLVGICDIVSANGGQADLLPALRRLSALGRLHSYAGWNTSANSTGTVIAHLSALSTWKSRGVTSDQAGAQAEFLNARLIDDCLYQGSVRSALVASKPKSVGKRLVAARRAAVRLEAEASSRHAVYRVKGGGVLRLDKFRVSWPWRRAFEIELTMRYRHQPAP
jgi:hypothetical protein